VPNKAFFVLGTDTSIGKTLVSGGLARSFLDLGFQSAAMKPVASGVVPVGHYEGQIEAFWEDIVFLDRADRHALRFEERSVYRFRLAASPHFAATAEGVEISLAHLEDRVRERMSACELLIIEGVGGVRVPLNSLGDDLRDFVSAMSLPVLLVVGLRLGCINHALLTMESLKAKNISVCAWVANAGIDPHYVPIEGTVHTLENLMGVSCSAIIPPLFPRAGGVFYPTAPNQTFGSYCTENEEKITSMSLLLRGLAKDLLT
jgi:dethiobiotin synthetase